MAHSPSHNHKTLHFPEGFLWGAATSAHQVEGNNTNSDWWQYEQRGVVPHRSGEACRHFERYEEDFDIAQSLQHNVHRLSIEWSRVEPEEGRWDPAAVVHYRNVLAALRRRNMQIVLTLHHFTNPWWFARLGGWERARNIRYFERYVAYIGQQLGDLVDWWVTINEPGVYVYQGYRQGVWPPFSKSAQRAVRVFVNMARALRRAYRILHALPFKRGSRPFVGISQNVISYATYRKHGFWDQMLVYFSDVIGNHSFYLLSSPKTHDFLGVNYYFRIRLRRARGTLFAVQDDVRDQRREVSDMGWEIYPHGIFDVLMDMADYRKPILITENGIATRNDDQRTRFLVSYIREIYHAIKGGADVRGYLYWSLLDNFEWADGFQPQFGLVGVAYERGCRRHIRNSAKVYADIIRHNGITHRHLQHVGHHP